MKYRKKPIVIEATQWFKNGDHPLDNCVSVRRRAPEDKFIKGNVRDQTGELVPDPTTGAPSFLCEGAIVRYYRRSEVSGDSPCISSIPCSFTMHDHGWIDTPEGGYTVCPGDWIITGVLGEIYPCKPSVFEATYEIVDMEVV